MNIKLGYYPVLDMALCLRQLYSRERFKPFVGALQSINEKLNEEEKDFIDNIGDKTNGWLDMIENLIDMTISGIITSEETILYISKHYEKLLEKYGDKEFDINFVNTIKSLWQNYFNNEVAKNSKAAFEKTMEISKDVESFGLGNYLLKISDRIQNMDDNTLKILIKPEHLIYIDKLENVIITPSIFATRNFTFWNNGQNYIFYISMNWFKDSDIEPSDMLLLKTLALNDKTRLKMLNILSKGSYSTADISEMLNLNSSTVSRHFKVFKDAGYVDIFSQEGNSIYYSLNIKEIEKGFEMLLNYIKNKE